MAFVNSIDGMHYLYIDEHNMAMYCVSDKYMEE